MSLHFVRHLPELGQNLARRLGACRVGVAQLPRYMFVGIRRVVSVWNRQTTPINKCGTIF